MWMEKRERKWTGKAKKKRDEGKGGWKRGRKVETKEVETKKEKVECRQGEAGLVGRG